MQKAYGTICDTLHPVSSIKAAESAKLLENTQRDVNIALMNEFTKIMHALDLDMHEIIEAAKTKFGFVPYKPGFVGGHCISIDPHYLAFEAKRHGVYPDLILAARKVNDGITQFVIQSMIKLFIKNNLPTNNLRVGIFGISYKENVLDIRNSLALKLVKELREYGFECCVHDPLAKCDIAGITMQDFEGIPTLSAAIIVVGHDYYHKMGLQPILAKCNANPVVLDIPNLFVDAHKQFKKLIYWNL